MTNAHGDEWKAVEGAPHRLVCGWCGSMDPATVARVVGPGVQIEPTDRKYGWPHKFYLHGPGLWGKFYTEHLQDASPEDRETIEKAIGLRFTFNGETVSWAAV